MPKTSTRRACRKSQSTAIAVAVQRIQGRCRPKTKSTAQKPPKLELRTTVRIEASSRPASTAE